MKSRKSLIYFLELAVIVGIFIVGFQFFSKQDTNQVYVSETDVIEEVTTENSVPAPNENDHYKWKANTGLVVINYFSLDCPHCLSIFLEEEKRKPFYENSFSLIYRHSPLPAIQPLSAEKAVIAECIYEQSGSEEMFNFIAEVFSNFNQNQLNNDWVDAIAQSYLNDRLLYTECLAERGPAIVERETKKALAHQVYGTPTIAVFRDDKLILRLDQTGERAVSSVYGSLSTLTSGPQ